MIRSRAVLSLLVLVGCGGGSGGDKLVDLSEDEAGELCDYVALQEGGQTSQDCGDGSKIFALTRSACIASFGRLPATCDATVADVEACADAVGTELCKLRSEPVCALGPQCTGP
jgi:hypothetical protein